jgi:hypothetical protein
MPKKSRARRDIALEQYELPGFAAGMVIHRLNSVLALLTACIERYGSNPYLQRIIPEIYTAIDETREWQIRAQEACNYPYHRKD